MPRPMGRAALQAKDDSSLEKLRSLLAGPDTGYACSGELHCPECVKLIIDKCEIKVQPEADLEALLSKASCATFGHGWSTRTDSKIRHGQQLNAKDFSIAFQGLEYILQEVKTRLFPEVSGELKAELSSLSIYKEGGRFRRHKEVPKGLFWAGSLVLCLPVPFAGGDFVLYHHGLEEVLEWGRNIDELDDHAAEIVQWAAFLEDVDHEVMQVEDGMQVTVKYTLSWVEWPAPASSPWPRKEIETQLCEELQRLVRQPTWLPEGRWLGFGATHMYGNDMFEYPSWAESLKPGFISFRLRGRDGMLARAALEAGLTVRLQPLFMEDPRERDPLTTMADVSYWRWLQDRCDPVRLAEEEDEALWVIDVPALRRRCEESPPAEFYRKGYVAGESSFHYFHCHVSLMIRIPPAAERELVKPSPLSIVEEATKKRKCAGELEKEEPSAKVAKRKPGEAGPALQRRLVLTKLLNSIKSKLKGLKFFVAEATIRDVNFVENISAEEFQEVFGTVTNEEDVKEGSVKRTIGDPSSLKLAMKGDLFSRCKKHKLGKTELTVQLLEVTYTKTSCRLVGTATLMGAGVVHDVMARVRDAGG